MPVINQRNKVFKTLEEAKKYAVFDQNLKCYNIVKITTVKNSTNNVLPTTYQDYFWFENAKNKEIVEKVLEWQNSGKINVLHKIPAIFNVDSSGKTISTTPEQIIDLAPKWVQVQKNKNTQVLEKFMDTPTVFWVVLDTLEIEKIGQYDSNAVYKAVASEPNAPKIDVLLESDYALLEQEYLAKKTKIQNQNTAYQKWFETNIEKIKQKVGFASFVQKPKFGLVKLSRINKENRMTTTKITFKINLFNVENEYLIPYNILKN